MIRTGLKLLPLLLFSLQVQAQKPGDTRKATLEFTKMETMKGTFWFLDVDTKDTVEYNILNMEKHNEAEYVPVKEMLSQLFAICGYSNNDCDFYGQRFTADMVYKTVEKDKIWNGTDWVLPPAKNEWIITSLDRDPTYVKPAIVYVYIPNPEDADTPMRAVYFFIGDTYIALDTVKSEKTKFQRLIGAYLCDLRTTDEYKDDVKLFNGDGVQQVHLNFSDKRYYQVSKEYNSDTYTNYYKLTVSKYREWGLVSKRIRLFDLKGKEMKTALAGDALRDATIRYINDKLGLANGLQVGSVDKTISVVNNFVFKDNNILYTRDWGQNPGNKKCSESKYETLYHDFYKFPISDIDRITDDTDEPGNVVSYFRIYLKTESGLKLESYQSCEEKGSGYSWEQSDTDKKMLQSLIVYYLKTGPDSFINIKNAILRLKELQ